MQNGSSARSDADIASVAAGSLYISTMCFTPQPQVPGREGPICCQRCQEKRRRVRRALPGAASRTGPRPTTSAGTPHRSHQLGGRNPPAPRPASRRLGPGHPHPPGPAASLSPHRVAGHNPALGAPVVRQRRGVLHEFKTQRPDEEGDSRVIVLDHDGHQAQVHRTILGGNAISAWPSVRRARTPRSRPSRPGGAPGPGRRMHHGVRQPGRGDEQRAG
jgi:hypothetical protein